MAGNQLELLNADTHASLKFSRWQGPRPHFVQIVAAEFAATAASYPIFISKSAENGQFFAGAMFGFRQGEDLGEESRSEAFLPLDLQRHGFYVSGDNIAIDPQNRCFSRTSGDPLFVDGLPSDALRGIQQALTRLKGGLAETETFIAVMLQHRLIEPIDVALRFDDGERLHLEGLYTISLDKLQDLDDRAIVALFRDGHLQLAYAMIGSQRQVAVLARRRNARLLAE
ncbi:SapC family protein [Sphingomonas oryzagri]